MRFTLRLPHGVGTGLTTLIATVLTGTAAMPVAADTITNGSMSAPDGIIIPGFLFEPEVPLNSLKTVPIWNELEQLLDNPYNMALCSALPASVDPLVRTTPGTTQITGSPTTPQFPAYCTNGNIIRRPGFGLTLPPLMLHPLNYNPPTGEESRLINPTYPGGRWMVAGDLLQCGSPEAAADPGVGPLCAMRGNDPNAWLQSYRRVLVTPGADRVDEPEIDNNAPIRGDVSNGLAGTFALAATSTSNGALLVASAIQDMPILGGDCVPTLETFPAPEGATTCGGDPGEPGGTANGVNGLPLLPAFGVNRANGYSRPAVPGVPNAGTPLAGSGTPNVAGSAPATGITARLFDIMRGGSIGPRLADGTGGLHKPSLRLAEFGGNSSSANYLHNHLVSDDQLTAPSNENDYIRDRFVAAALGKALFWDMQVGSDAVQSCGSCHAHAGADNRVKNMLNPNHLGNDVSFEVEPPNGTLTIADYPFQKLTNPNVAADPKCTTPLVANVDQGVLENIPNAALTGATSNASGVHMVVCNSANLVANKNNHLFADGSRAANDVASSMGVHWGVFKDIQLGLNTGKASAGVSSVLPDVRESRADCETLEGTDTSGPRGSCLALISDPIPGFAGHGGTGEAGVNNQFRRVEPRNTPTIFAAALNFDNFWDGRASHDFNGGSVFGASDPQSHVFVDNGGALVPTRQLIRFVSMAALATGPGLSEFEMSLLGRNWSKIGKKLLQAGVTPLANQLVDPTDSLLGPYSNQPGNPTPSPLCSAGALAGRAIGKPGLCTSYTSLIAAAYYPALHANTTQHLDGCYTDGRTEIHPNQCTTGAVPVLTSAGNINVDNIADPFDGYKLSVTDGPAGALATNEFTQMEGNFSLFWGLSVITWANNLMPDNSPYDQFVDQNPDAFEAIGEVGEAGLVGPMPVCTSSTQRHCIRNVGNFQRDNNLNCAALGLAGQACRGARNPSAAANQPDPLLGMDIFQGSNISLKNPNFRAGRCGECHAGGTFTDNTIPFTTKAQIGDFIGEFLSAGNEASIEPLGRTRVITGFLAEDELNGNGQDTVERRIANQSIVPCPADGLGYPGGTEAGGPGTGFGLCSGAAQAFFDNGVYNLGVTRCDADETDVVGVCDDNGHGGTDAFGWPLSHAAKVLKNLGGPGQQPGTEIAAFDSAEGSAGGLFELTAHDQEINPGDDPESVESALEAASVYLGPYIADINHGDSAPEMDEVFGGLNTLTDTAMLEGFIDTLGPFNNSGVLNESMNDGDAPLLGTWPMVNRVGRFGSMKAAQLREVELTGPYFHNGGKLTLRQVVDFYQRGGDFPISNATHRDFNMVNQNVEVQSNLSEAEKVALVDFLMELTDDRVRFERAPFDHPQVIIPLDGSAPDNDVNLGRDAMLTNCVTLQAGNILGPGQRTCMDGVDPATNQPTKLFLDVPAVGSAGGPAVPNFLGIAGRNPTTGLPIRRVSGAAARGCTAANASQYCSTFQ